MAFAWTKLGQQIIEQYGLDKSPGWNRTWRKVGVEIIIENPQIFIKQYAKGLASIFLGSGSETLIDLASGVVIGTTSPPGGFLGFFTPFTEGVC